MDSIMQRFCFPSFLVEEQPRDEFRWLRPERVVHRHEQLHRFASAAYTLYWQTERVRRQAISWRNFCVGCGMWAYRKDASQVQDVWQAFYGMNTKVEQNSRNICAEPIPLNAALTRNCTEIIGMVVVGYPREEDSSKTLRPCDHCRLLMKRHPLIRPYTIIITALPPKPGTEPENWDEITHEIFTFQELLQEYGED